MGFLLSKPATRAIPARPFSNEPSNPSQSLSPCSNEGRLMLSVTGDARSQTTHLQDIGSEGNIPDTQFRRRGSNLISPVLTTNSHDVNSAVDTEQANSSQVRGGRLEDSGVDHRRIEVPNPYTQEPMLEGRVIREKLSLKILDPSLTNALKQATVGAAGVYQHEEIFATSTMHETYEFIIHNWSRIESHIEKDGKKGRSGQSIKPLLDFFRRTYAVTLEKLGQINSGDCTKIAFEDLWLIYPPGETVFKNDNGGWRAYKVERVEACPRGSLTDMAIYAYYLDFDESGQWLIPHLEVLSVSYYSSSRTIGNLEIVPEWYFRKCGELLARLINRGRDYFKFGEKVSYMEYEGDTCPITSSTYSVRVIIDYVTPSKYNGDADPSSRIGHSSCLVCLGNDINLYSYPNGAPHNPDICRKGGFAHEEQQQSAVNDNIPWLFCASTIWAFSMWHKTWKRIPPGNLAQVRKQDAAFDALCMDQVRKRDLDSMLSTHLTRGLQHTNTDVISAKGGGFNVLLHGIPGTGKTMTAECLAERYGCPLYMITCGDLETDPDVLEQRLCQILLRAKNWKAILLLDDADVFIASRGAGEIRRNALVSIFLRHLEYSDVFFFMTTNQANFLDMAIESRLHMSLPFYQLYFDDQKLIWYQSIRKLGEALTEDSATKLKGFVNHRLEHLDDKAYTKMNGRQIRNCMSAALSLAEADGVTLDESHIKKVLKIGNEFTKFMRKHSTQTKHSKMTYDSEGERQ